jgi:pimeloyl-ACP methyl ester carboxylesterase
VVAPDLLGHGRSDKPPGDYSLGAFACTLRDLLVALGHERATVVGQSLGGGVAMQFSYQYPERTERLVLVGSGGLGREVNPLLRLLSLPGSAAVLRLACAAPVRGAIESVGSVRRECLDHVVVLGERHLRQLLEDSFAPCHRWCCHQSLERDGPVPRPVQPPEAGEVVEIVEAGGLYGQYERVAA